MPSSPTKIRLDPTTVSTATYQVVVNPCRTADLEAVARDSGQPVTRFDGDRPVFRGRVVDLGVARQQERRREGRL